MPGSPARSSGAPCTRGASPWPKPSRASRRDTRARPAARRWAWRARAAGVEPDDPARGGGRPVAPRAARCLPLDGRARRTLAAGARYRPSARARWRDLAVRRPGHRVRHGGARRRREPTRTRARSGRGARRSDRHRDGRRRVRSRRSPGRPTASGAPSRPTSGPVLRRVHRRGRGTETRECRRHDPAQGELWRGRTAPRPRRTRRTRRTRQQATGTPHRQRRGPAPRRASRRAARQRHRGDRAHHPPSRISLGRWTALEVRLAGVPDLEPRDDARLFLLEVSRQPSVVLLASPPDWDTRFLARAMEDVARVPVKTLVQAEPGATRWRDAATLAPISPGEVARLVATAPLTIEAGEPSAFARLALPGAALVWPLGRRQDGDWYVQPPGPSPVAATLAGVVWDSLPPATSLTELASDSAITVALGARLARRGPPRPVVVLSERGGHRRALIAAAGLYRWAFRGGASAEAYRALVAALTDWLLGSSSAGGERFAAVTNEVPNGMPLAWRWTGSAEPRPIILALAAEWRPGAALVASQPGGPGTPRERVALRDGWWLFALAIALFATEWGWRRRTGRP